MERICTTYRQSGVDFLLRTIIISTTTYIMTSIAINNNNVNENNNNNNVNESNINNENNLYAYLFGLKNQSSYNYHVVQILSTKLF